MIGFQYTVQPVPVTYNGVKYRSVLEATWAAFFDAVGWKHVYEPKRYGDWLVDFVIHGHKDILVEVKPVTAFPVEVSDEIDRCVPAPKSDENSLTPHDQEDREVLILGVSPVFDAGHLGWIREYGWWEKAALGFWTDGKGTLGFCHDQQSYHDRISGGHDGGCHGSYAILEGVNDYVSRMWKLAEIYVSTARENEKKARLLLPKTCQNCFAFSSAFKPVIRGSSGECRFNPPIVSGEKMKVWPVVKTDDWCRHFKVGE